MENKKKKENIIVKIFYLLLISFIVLYFSKSSGYYEYATHRQVSLNESQIEKFEKDVKDGKNVSIEEYVKSGEINYSNFASNIGNTVSSCIKDVVTNGIDGTMDFLGQLFNG